MRERAELTGSRLEVGPTPDGGWQVRLRIPRNGPVDVLEPV
jgi:signal transduction histidine kinase